MSGTFLIEVEAQVNANAVDQRFKFFAFAFSTEAPIDSLYSKMALDALRRTDSALAKKNHSHGWGLYSAEKELMRQGILPETPGIPPRSPFASKLRLSDINKDFSLCATYPPVFAVCAEASDRVIKGCASFRTKGRMPMFC